MASTRTRPPLISVILAIIYATALNLSLPQTQAPPGWPSLPLRHSSLLNLLPCVLFESLFISRLSHSTFASFGACLHLLKASLLSTIYQYFKIGFKAEICRSLAFDLVNYLGQFVLFYLFRRTEESPRGAGGGRAGEPSRGEKQAGVEVSERRAGADGEEEAAQTAGQERKNMLVMSLLTWTFISIIDGVWGFVIEKNLGPKIEGDVRAYLSGLERDEYFLLKSAPATPPADILRAIPPIPRSMRDHQLLSPLINLPYFFSSASLISLPADIIMLDRLSMLSLDTKGHWLAGLVLRRALNSALAYFLKS